MKLRQIVKLEREIDWFHSCNKSLNHRAALVGKITGKVHVVCTSIEMAEIIKTLWENAHPGCGGYEVYEVLED